MCRNLVRQSGQDALKVRGDADETINRLIAA
jgi:hypothetical protein